jgi:hypothetical protein
MNQMRLSKLAIAGSTVACAALFSFSWSEQRGVSLSVESAQARVGRPLTPLSGAGVARRQYRRSAYRAGAVGAGVAGAAAVGTAAAVAATSPNWGWGNNWGWGGGWGGNWGWGGSPYYGGYANRSYVTGRPTLFPRYYGGTYAGGGYPVGYYGGYANRSYVTGRPTLIPRYYGGYGQYYGSPNNRGGLVGGSDAGTYRP